MKHIFLLIALMLSPLKAECEMWYEDNNLGQAGYFPADAKAKFLDIKSWKTSLKNMDIYLIRINSLYKKKNNLTDYFVKNKMLKVLKKHHVKLALDVRGATLSSANSKHINIRNKELKVIKKIENMGTHIDSINFQSALSKSLKKNSKKYKSSYPLKQRITDIVTYAKIVHQQYPHIKFGLIDASPTKGYAYKKPYLQLIQAMKKEHLSLHHIILDLPYNFIVQHKHSMTWKKTLEVEKYVKNELHLKYGKIYHDAKGGRKSDKLFYNNVMKMAKQYSSIGGDPDYCLLMSWYAHPSKTIPETQKYTQMYTFLKLAKVLK